jgi:hypothetical protein
MTVKIEETLSIEIEDIGDQDYPDQYAEHRVSILQRDLVVFIRHIAYAHTVSVAECNVVLYRVALALLESYEGQANSELLRERLAGRFSGLKQPLE